jgi:hypothetical protein
MINPEDIAENVAEGIRNILSLNLGKKSDEERCVNIKGQVDAFLFDFMYVNRLAKVPIVRVVNEGPFITINFFDKEDNRLESVPDMIKYMELE